MRVRAVPAMPRFQKANDADIGYPACAPAAVLVAPHPHCIARALFTNTVLFAAFNCIVVPLITNNIERDNYGLIRAFAACSNATAAECGRVDWCRWIKDLGFVPVTCAVVAPS